MKSTVCVVGLLALFSCAAMAKVVTSPKLTQAKADTSVINYLVKSNAIEAAADPAATAACFNQYLPILSEIATSFSAQFQACITLADQEITNLTNQAAASKNDFVTETQSMCAAYTQCNSEADVLTFFDCYASTSSDEVSIVYNISTNAASAAAALAQGIKVVENAEDQCKNATEKTYVDNTAATYALLDSCLAAAGQSTIPPITLPTVATNVINANAFVAQTDCSNDAGTHTQTSADGSQTQSQTGPGCQSQNSGSGSQSQSQSGDGSQSQSQCSGSDCGEFKPFPSLFN